MSIVFFALASFSLAVLAALNARQVAKDRMAINGHADRRLLYFATVEVRRAWMRSAGWGLFFAAMVVRISMEQGQGRTLMVTLLILFGFGVFVYEALWGRRVRHEIMWSEVNR